MIDLYCVVLGWVEWCLALLLRWFAWAGWRISAVLREQQRMDVDRFKGATGVFWWHASSLGEVRLAAHMIMRVGAGRRHLLTVQTSHGLALAHKLLPSVRCLLAPRDVPRTLEQIFRQVRPDALLLIETELWPIQLAIAAQRGVPVFILNARISDKTAPWYRIARRLFAPSLAQVTALCRSELDRMRYIDLGISPGQAHVVGDLKLLTVRQREPLIPVEEPLRSWLEEAPVIVVSCPGKDELPSILMSYCRAKAQLKQARLLIAPRHPVARGRDPVLAGFSHRSQLIQGERPEILVLDSMGELSSVYFFSVVMVAGGTWMGDGGHSLVEAARWGNWVIYGPRARRQEGQCALLSKTQTGILVEDVELTLESSLVKVVEMAEAIPRAERRAVWEEFFEIESEQINLNLSKILTLF